MAHNIDMTNGRANIAFLGSNKDIWHRLGQEMASGQSTGQWAESAGLAWSAVKVPALADLTGAQFAHLHLTPGHVLTPAVEARNFVVRSDNGHALGYVSDVYQPVQPIEVLEWFERYIGVDDRFALDVAGSLKNGEIIWATATYRDTLNIVGEPHVARLLMTTTFDGSGATINKATMTRVVCNNTLDAAMLDKRATVRTRHNTKFDAARVGKELSALAESFDSYRVMAEAMVAVEMSAADVSAFFKQCLDIPFDAKREDISGKKMAQFQALSNSYSTTVREGTAANTQWAALNAITRYVDHEKSVKGGVSKDEARVLSANFGTGALLKAKALNILMPRLAVAA